MSLPKLDPARFIWFRVGGDLELHLMLNDERPPERAHFCLVVDDLEGLRARVEAAGFETRDATELVGRPRFFCHDPFGNLIELTQDRRVTRRARRPRRRHERREGGRDLA